MVKLSLLTNKYFIRKYSASLFCTTVKVKRSNEKDELCSFKDNT